MTAEELVGLMRKTDSWGYIKILEVFDGLGVYNYLLAHGADKFAEKVKSKSGLTVNDLKVGDIITCGKDRYVVLAIENDIQDDLCGVYIFDGEQTAYIINCDLEDFRKTNQSVAYQVNNIMNVLNPERESENPF